MKRVAAIDLLRALAIIGMVLSGSIFFLPEMPAYMFHAQTPPPTFVFNPDVAGITWVDLVFPFFLFSMGASMPLALRRREQNGATLGSVIGSAVHRFVWLAAFAIVLGNTGMYLLGELESWAAALVTLCVWSLFFIMFIRLPKMDKGRNTLLNWGGFLALVGVTMLYKPLFGVDIDIEHNNIIILILANMALFGTLIWWFTRNNPIARIVIIAAFAMLKMASGVEGSWTANLWQQTPAAWLSQFEFLKYLCVVLCGTIVGDMIYRSMNDSNLSKESSSDKGLLSICIALTTLATIVFMMWGLFAREVEITVYITAALCLLLWFMLKGLHSEQSLLYRQIFLAAMAMLLIGLITEPMEGGIKKDHATISYFFTTSAMAAMVILSALIFEMRFNLRLKFLEACGANPMFAYVAAGYLITPLLTLCCLMEPLNDFSIQCTGASITRGVLFALLVVTATYLFTRKNYYWKS
ncbi:MAG: DUF5009 domain-containing protein [Alistipes sp.]|nr:DUF5009 domain-containing protein [Alistipes sp.]